MTAPFSEFDTSNRYYTTLAEMALRKAANGRPLPVVSRTFAMNQARAMRELDRGHLDLVWIGTDWQKEQKYRAVKIPLDMGLMGYRRFLLHREKLAAFSRVKSLDQLSQYLACQGIHWPDTRILKSANLQVLATPIHENLYNQLNRKRCDYFPRGFHEGPTELNKLARQYPDFVLLDDLILYYPFTTYFFTTKDKEWLAAWVEQGLEQMIDDGELIQFMREQPLTSHVFPLSNYQEATFILLENTEMSPDMDFTNPRYWLLPDSFRKGVENVQRTALRLDPAKRD